MIIACVADRSKLYYKRAEEDRALAQTTVDDQGRVNNFAKSSQELLGIDYVQGSYLVSKAGNWQANFGVSPGLKLVYQTMTTA